MRGFGKKSWIVALLVLAALGAPAAAFDEEAYLLRSQGAQDKEPKGDYAGAAADYEALVTIDPNSAPMHWTGACRNRVAAGEIAQALKDCNAALAEMPSYPPAHDARGLVYLKTGEFEKARAEFDAALSIYPNVAFSFYGRGLAKLKLGDSTGGNADIARANDSDPDMASRFARYGISAEAGSIAGPPACAGSGSGSGGQDLAAIRQCMAIYCAAGADAKTRANIKHIDDMLVEFQVRISTMNAAVQKFRRTCRVIAGDLKAQGEPMAQFRMAVFDLGMKKGQLSRLFDSAQTSPEADIFAGTATDAARKFKQPACMNEINQRTSDALNGSQDLLEKSSIACSPEEIKNWK